MAPITFTTRGYATVKDEHKDYGYNQVGGRVDIRKSIEGVDVAATVTDNTFKDLDAGPAFRDVLITADKTLSDNAHVGLGYDTGLKNAFGSIKLNTDISSRTASAKATWFQKGNQVRTEGDLRIDANNSVWGSYTFNDAGPLANATFLNLKQRDGLVIAPFTFPVSTSAVTYTHKRGEYVFKGAYDIARSAPFVGLSRKVRWNSTLRGAYAIKDEVALVELTHTPVDRDLPQIKVFAKSPAGKNGFGPISGGIIVEKVLNL